MKNILIPSDFSVKSLKCMDILLHRMNGERLNITLFHLFHPSDSITELMLLGREQKESQFIGDEFLRACRQLRQNYLSRLLTIRAKCFYGNTLSVFKNLLDGHDIDVIALPADYQFKKLSDASVDPTSFLEKCGRKTLVLAPLPEVEIYFREESLWLSERL